ncbi:MAG: hypothetical protein JEZ12_15980 [Desulfobacterium sp.]|nr:hypothetical protein [Desulfobacterium sp.]
MERFIDLILAEVPGCPEIIIKGKVLASAIRFCGESWIWQKPVTETVSIGDTSISLTLPEKTVVAGIKELTVDGRSFALYIREGNVLTLDEAATSGFDIKATIALKPARTTTVLPDTLCEDWYEGIEAGAKELLMIMPGKPWYNPELAGAYSRRYNGEVNAAKIKANQKNDITQNRVRMRPFV